MCKRLSVTLVVGHTVLGNCAVENCFALIVYALLKLNVLDNIMIVYVKSNNVK